ncbi:MAG TPA: hypothetical protein PKN48_00410 [Bacteroidales bacterium]|nr:hypothetical protein [Bacteroidales bacterium]
MNIDKIKETLLSLEEEQKGREAQVQQWKEQIERLTEAIKQTKEVHDFTRGKLAALREVIKLADTDEVV